MIGGVGSRLPSGFHAVRKHIPISLFIVVQHQCQYFHHLPVPAGLPEQGGVPSLEGRWQFQEEGVQNFV